MATEKARALLESAAAMRKQALDAENSAKEIIKNDVISALQQVANKHGVQIFAQSSEIRISMPGVYIGSFSSVHPQVTEEG